MAARRDSKIVLLSFSGEAKVVPVQVFSVLRSVGLKVPGEVDALQRKPLRGMNCFDVRFTSEAARVRGVHVLEGVEGLKVTPYDSSVWVTVLHLPLDMSEQVVVRTLGRFGKVTGYEEPEFLECKGVKTGTRRVRIELKSDIPSTLWANGHRAHIAYPGQPRTCWRCGLEGHEARLCPNKRCSRCLQVGHTLAECKGDIVCNSCGKTGHLARLCPDRSYAAEWLRAWLKRSLSRPLTPYHMMLLSSPQCPTLAPRWRLCSPFRVRPLP
ncbi:putative zinc finger CCHC domain-containing protein 3-like [Apostichopus japonicus]|uniref:Putative zinc finger CCHC domain-containing protein 3-like n=1 Tax=Stichopus japonicus TaxID=307972 RepID=A0A2G8L6Q2_STIJA|nr:putative zinc finger CCHC domain-containing protein 3-like [Apostichopus japonicus]